MVRLVAQLDGSGTASFDCGPASTAMAVDRASGGQVRPAIRVVRTKMRVPSGPTDPWDWKRALDEFDGAMKREGLRPIPSRLVAGGDLGELHDLLIEKRRAVLLAIDYGTVARLTPRLWSSTSFRGNHAILVDGGRERDGRDEGRVLDPLADGRTIGGKRMVRGPRWWPWPLIRAAAANVKGRDGEPIYPGGDRWLGVVVRRAAPIERPEPPEVEPEPPDPPTPDDRLADALDALERQIEGLQDAYELVRSAAGEDSGSDAEPAEGLSTREP
jgi:hypothetical protein